MPETATGAAVLLLTEVELSSSIVTSGGQCFSTMSVPGLQRVLWAEIWLSQSQDPLKMVEGCQAS